MGERVNAVRFFSDDDNPVRRDKIGVVIGGSNRRVVVLSDAEAADLISQLQHALATGPVGNARNKE